MLPYLHAWLTARTRDERGASAVEYGLLVAGIVALSIVYIWALGETLGEAFSESHSQIEAP